MRAPRRAEAASIAGGPHPSRVSGIRPARRTAQRRGAALLARPGYVGADPAVIAQGLGEIIFHQGEANAPKLAQGVWLLGQTARWGQAPSDMEDAELAARVYPPHIYAAACRLQSGS